jgi:hypothetical protein
VKAVTAVVAGTESKVNAPPGITFRLPTSVHPLCRRVSLAIRALPLTGDRTQPPELETSSIECRLERTHVYTFTSQADE